MKLKNKKTGEIGYPYFQNWKEITCVIVDENAIQIAEYTSLAELNEEWEDYTEEQKEWWYIDIHGPHKVTNNDEYYQQVKVASKEIGNYFETKEEAEKAVEKLKAWKRLKDFGCRFTLDDHFAVKFIGPDARKIASAEEQRSLSDSYKLLFGGEE